MANDERDRKFEKALAYQLRSSAAGDSVAQNTACPDAEILAAYHERSLSLEELTSWKKHIAGCARCQEILAQLEVTGELLVAAEEGELNQVSIASAGGVGLPATAREWTMAAAPAQTRAAANPPQSERATVATLRPRKTPWRWIAPAGAIAAGLLVWVAIHEKSSVRPPQSPQTEIALNREPAPTPTQPLAPATQAESPASIPPEPPADKKKESLARERVSPKAAYTLDGISKPELKPSANAAAAPPPEPPKLTDDTALDARSPQPGGAAGGLIQSVAPKPSPQPGNSVVGGAYAGSLSSKRATTASPSAAPAPAEKTQQQQQADQAVGAAAQSVEVTSAAPLQSRMASNGRGFQDLRTIIAPDGHTIWMVGPSGFVQRSDNTGKSWKLQKSGVTYDLRAGSAPTPKICWVVGSAGAVLRTVDGGKNWTKLNSPVEADLNTVVASDALHATVTDATNKISFVTNDGGITWTPVAGE